MPRPPKKATAPQVKKTKLNLQLREVMGDAYSFVLGERFTDQINGVTLESLMTEQINLVEGSDGVTAIRRNKQDELDHMINQLETAAAKIKKVPPKDFQVEADERMADPNSPAQANTPLNGNS